MRAPLTDESEMPFGQFHGEPMRSIDISYYNFLWNREGLRHKQLSRVGDYIRERLDRFKKEYPGMEW